MSINIEELTIGEARELARLVSGLINEGCTQPGIRQHPYQVGEKWFIRTVTHHLIGEIVEICDICMVLKNCTWVADDGRFNEAMKGEWSDNAEHEPYPPKMAVPVHFSAIIDSMLWNYDLPSKTK